MKRRINPRPPAFTPGPIITEIRAGDELLFTLHEERDEPPVAQSRLRVTTGPDNFLTFNMEQGAEVEDRYTYYLLLRIVRHGENQA